MVANLCEIITVEKGFCLKYSNGILEYFINDIRPTTTTKYNFIIPFRDVDYICLTTHIQGEQTNGWKRSESTKNYIILINEHATINAFIKGFWK